MATKTAQAQPSVRNMLRTLSHTGMPGPNGEMPVEQVNADVGAVVDQGYTLVGTHYAGETPAGIRMLYVLVKNGTG